MCIVFCCLLLSACSVLELDGWRVLEDGLSRRQFVYEKEEIERDIIMFRVDQDYFRFEFHFEERSLDLLSWIQEEDAQMVLNGSYFHEDLLPSGYFVSQRERVGQRAFDFDKSGFLVARNGVFDIVSVSSEEQLMLYDFVLQSYPYFIRDGKKAIESDSEKRARRTFIGLDAKGYVYLGVVPYGDLSLFELMHILDSLPIDFVHVLNLDGGTSTGLVVDMGEYEEKVHAYVKVPNVVVVRRKSQ